MELPSRIYKRIMTPDLEKINPPGTAKYIRPTYKKKLPPRTDLWENYDPEPSKKLPSNIKKKKTPQEKNYKLGPTK